MNISTSFVRILFVIISLIFMITYAVGIKEIPSYLDYILGIALGLGFGGILFGIDFLFKRFNLRSFNVAVIGLFFGYLMGLALVLLLDALFRVSSLQYNHYIVELVKIFFFLFGTYLGVIMTLRASNEISISIPFIRLTPTVQKTKEILLDFSALSDPRIIDLASSGLLDKRILIPRFLLNDIYEQEESTDETVSTRAKRALEVIKKLETLPDLGLRYNDTDFPDIKDNDEKILKLARLLDAIVLSADISCVQISQIEGIKIINLHSISKALKPLMQKGETMKIKIQRYGKEEMQGVGYLEDGTMVVVNGAGEFIGETVSATVLSVKHTSSGRIIFCNVAENEGYGMPQ